MADGSSNLSYRALFKVLPGAGAILNVEGVFLDVNLQFEALTGAAHNEVVGKHFARAGLFKTEAMDRYIALFERLTSGEDISGTTLYVTHRDGSERVAEIYPSRITMNGETVAYQILGADVTERRRVRESLKKYERELEIRNSIAMAFLTLSDDRVFGDVLNIVLQATESEFGFFGYVNDTEDLVSPSLTHHIWDKCKMENKTMVFPHSTWEGIWGRALTEGKCFIKNTPLRVPDGHVGITRAMSMPVIDRGEVIGVFCIANKKTDYDERDTGTLTNVATYVAPILRAWLEKDRLEEERRAAAEALRESEERFRLLFEEMATGFALQEMIYDESGQPCDYRFLNVNPMYEKLTGAKAEDTVGKRVMEVFPSTERVWVDLFAKVVETGEPIQFTQYSSAIGRYFEVRAYRAAPGRFASTFQDVTEQIKAEAESRKFKDINEIAQFGIVIIDTEGTIEYVNRHWADAHGMKKEYLPGKNMRIFHTEKQMADVMQYRRELEKTDSVPARELWHVRSDGTEFPMLMTALSMRDENGKIKYIAATGIDITNIKRAEEELLKHRDRLEALVSERTTEIEKAYASLEKSEQLFRTIANFTYDWEYWVAPDGEYIYMSPSCERITGFPPEEFSKTPDFMLKITHPEDIEMHSAHQEKFTESTTEGYIEFRIIAKNGEERWIEHLCRPVFDEKGVFIGRRISNRDITIRKRMERKLNENQKRLQALSRQLITAQEESRARLSRELHDQMGKRLTALSMETEYILLQKRINKSNISKLSDLIVKAASELRRICKGLRPMELDDFGLETALIGLSKEYSDLGGFKVETDISCLSHMAIDQSSNISIYRVVQESLTNILRHAEASNVVITASAGNESLTISVRDDGKGFDPSGAQAGDFHFGLLGMRERALLCNGDINITSRPGEGTCVKMTVPATAVSGDGK